MVLNRIGDALHHFFFLSFYCASCILYLTWLLMNYLSSGDTDSVVPVTATRYSIDALKLPTITNWSPWYDNGKVSAIYIYEHALYNKKLELQLYVFDQNFSHRHCNQIRL